MHTMPVRVARAAVVLGLAIAGYLLFIPVSHVQRSLLHQLVVRHTSVAGLSSRPPTVSQAVPPSRSTFEVMKKAARTDPDHTGLYEREWYLSPGAPPEVGILVQLLPDPGRARAALADSEKRLSQPPTLQGQTASAPSAFTVPSVPGVHANSYALSTSGTPSGYAYLVTFRSGRAVVSELIVAPDKVRSVSGPSADVRNEHALLVRAEPGFSMVQVHVPVVASVVYWVVALALVVGAFVVPEWAVGAAGRRRERREAKELERERSEYRSRGRRAVRRHRAPAWQQSRRR